MILPIQPELAKRLEVPPLLAVEILSPSTRQRDLHLKKRAYEDASLGWYWIVDPDAPSLTIFRLVDGRFVEEASVSGDDAYRSTAPVTVDIVPAELVRPRNADHP
ncbi:MAG TPA: Uma2 family endonuclease [Acidimicrobiales bacterium]|nr:Uma2 family endonuclease [Acidimicrobiales bacterium]